MSIFGEKMYKLHFDSKNQKFRSSGIKKGLHKEFKDSTHSLYAKDKTIIVQSGFRRQAGGGVHLITETKHILNGVQPKKRFFIHSQHSYTY